MLAAVAVWSLREEGFISLEIAEASQRMVNWSPLTKMQALARIKVTKLKKASIRGLEGDILRQIAAPKMLFDAIRSCVGEDQRYRSIPSSMLTAYEAEGAVVRAVVDHATTFGYLEAVEVQRGLLGRFLRGNTTLVGNCAKIATLEGAYSDAAVRWQHFMTTEAVLHNALVEDCAKSIKSCQYPSY